MKPTRIAVYGAGGLGREVAWLVESCSTPEHAYDVACFVDDAADKHGQKLNGVEVVSLETARRLYPEAQVAVAIGAPRTREALVRKAEAAGFRCATLVHPCVQRSRWVEMGEGAVICAGNILTVNIRLGRQVQINLDCTIGHDVIMDDYTTLAPGVHVSGFVQFGKRVYVGTGAVIINGTVTVPLVIGDDAVIGAGSCVIRAVAPGATVVGVPAKEIMPR